MRLNRAPMWLKNKKPNSLPEAVAQMNKAIQFMEECGADVNHDFPGFWPHLQCSYLMGHFGASG